MARPVYRNSWSYNPTGQPAMANAPYARRSGRRRINPVVALSVLFGLLLVAFIIVGLAIIFQPAEGAASGAAPAAQPKPGLAQIFNLPMPAGQTKILLLGSDQRPGDNGYRTDTIILVTVDADKKSVSVVSFPRDLWVKVPSLYEMKINQVQALGGFDATAEMFEANFGVKPDYYVLTNFGGFTKFIDSQGGVNVEVGQDLTDECSLPQAVNSMCSVKKGAVHMNGATALWYVRSRHSSSDFDRLRRAQEVVYAIFKDLVNNISLDKLSAIKAALQDNIQTNLSVENAIAFMPVAAHVLEAPDQIKSFAIDEKQATPSWSWNGMWILLPDAEAIQGVLKDAGIKP